MKKMLVNGFLLLGLSFLVSSCSSMKSKCCTKEKEACCTGKTEAECKDGKCDASKASTTPSTEKAPEATATPATDSVKKKVKN